MSNILSPKMIEVTADLVDAIRAKRYAAAYAERAQFAAHEAKKQLMRAEDHVMDCRVRWHDACADEITKEMQVTI